MKNIVVVVAVFLGLRIMMADEPSPVYEQIPLPAGPLIKRVPGYSQWQIMFFYEKGSKSANSGHAETVGADQAISLQSPKVLTVTRTTPRWHSELVFGDGKKKEIWFDSTIRFELGPEPSTVVPIAEFNPGYDPQFLDYSVRDFPDVEWVSPQTYLGTQKDTPYWVFRLERDGPMVWVDSTTRFPVRWRRGSEIRIYKFLPSPTEILTLPTNVAGLSQSLEKLRQLSEQVPPHR